MAAKQTTRALVLMGVAGSGKTTVGAQLAERLGWTYFEGDDFHPPANLAKMAEGRPLDDKDRAPWLERLNQLLHDQLGQGASLVLACSALKAEYRQRLRSGLGNRVKFVYLKGDYDLIHARLKSRSGHFMHADMLRSQFAALEEPSKALVVDVDQPPAEIVEQILKDLDSIA